MSSVNGEPVLVTVLERTVTRKFSRYESLYGEEIALQRGRESSFRISFYTKDSGLIYKLLSLQRDQKIVVFEVGGEYLFGEVSRVEYRREGVKFEVSVEALEVPSWGTTLVNSTEYGGEIVIKDVDEESEGDYLDPVKANTNFTIDWDNRFFSYEFIVENKSYENNPTILVDDSQTGFWSVVGSGTGSLGLTISDDANVKKSGNDALKLSVISGSYENVGIKHTFSSAQDWSGYDFVTFYLFGMGTGRPIYFYVLAPDWSNYFSWTFYDSFEGWRQIVLPLRKPTYTTGSPSITNVSEIDFFLQSSDGWEDGNFAYLDRLRLDIGQWSRIEIMVPDKYEKWLFINSGTNISANIYTYNVGINSWIKVRDWFENKLSDYIYEDNFKFLNSFSIQEIYGGEYRSSGVGSDVFFSSEAGSTVTVAYSTRRDRTITYTRRFGTAKRWGFMIKFPPKSDVEDISKARIKVEVYFAKSDTTLNV